MLRHKSLLVSLVLLMDQLPWPSEPPKRLRGRPKTSSDRLFLKAPVILSIRRLSTAYALPTFLEQNETMAQQLRPLLYEQGRFPTRRTWERRLTALPQHLPGLIGCLGRHLVAMLMPFFILLPFSDASVAVGGLSGASASLLMGSLGKTLPFLMYAVKSKMCW